MLVCIGSHESPRSECEPEFLYRLFRLPPWLEDKKARLEGPSCRRHHSLSRICTGSNADRKTFRFQANDLPVLALVGEHVLDLLLALFDNPERHSPDRLR